jgi:nucleotide-binding universal stress UspA family protein
MVSGQHDTAIIDKVTGMYQRILVPIDGSSTSERALQEAVKISEGKALIRLVFVLEEILTMSSEGFDNANDAFLQEAARKNAEKILASAAEKVGKSGAQVESVLRDELTKSVVDIIIEETQSWLADLIVIGTHGRTGLTRLLLGSVAEGVVREATMPVLLIRESE